MWMGASLVHRAPRHGLCLWPRPAVALCGLGYVRRQVAWDEVRAAPIRAEWSILRGCVGQIVMVDTCVPPGVKEAVTMRMSGAHGRAATIQRGAW